VITANEVPRLSRSLPDTPASAPVRMVHLGVGNFTRAHQAWYTTHSPDADQWGIAGFTGRRRDTADALAPQDGLYTLITRSAEGDTFELIGALSAVHAAADHETFLDYLSRPEVAIVTITVTEAGYLRGADGHLDASRDVVVADLEALRSDPRSQVGSLPARLVAGLLARRAAGGEALTILSCDNLPENGPVTRTVVKDLAALVDEALPDWIDSHVDFATSMVDRITPATTDEDRALVEKECGYVDAYPVPTEPFSEWVVSGAFPAGRPRWEEAGARLVDDVEPFEQRKLWLLNGSHSMLAYAGSVRGYSTIDEAIADPKCRSWVEAFWDEASQVPFPASLRHRQLPRSAADAIRQPSSPPPADPDRAGRVHQAARSYPADCARRAVSRTGAHRVRHDHRRLDPASARARRAGQGPRGWRRPASSQFR
jgi:fructuronate reductase